MTRDEAKNQAIKAIATIIEDCDCYIDEERNVIHENDIINLIFVKGRELQAILNNYYSIIDHMEIMEALNTWDSAKHHENPDQGS